MFVSAGSTKRCLGAAALAIAALTGCGSQPAEAPNPAVTSPPSTSMSMHDHSNMPGMNSGISLKNNTPAGDITMPMLHTHEGMAMADPNPCTAVPTAVQQQATVDLVNKSWADARKYESLATAQADGYVPVTPSGRPVVHYINRDYYRATVDGSPVLDTTRPQSLVYANTSHGAVLVAVMFISGPFGETPQPGDCLTQWHVHTNLCLSRDQGVVGTIENGCPPGSTNRTTAPMLHIWFVPIPGGPMAIDASDPDIVAAAEKVAAPPNGTA